MTGKRIKPKRKGTGSGRTLWGTTKKLPKDKRKGKRRTAGEIVTNSWLGNG